MDNNKLEEKVEKNSNEIHALALQMSQLAQIVSNREQRHLEDMGTFREAVASISKLNERMSSTLLLEKTVAHLNKDLEEAKTEIRMQRHDFNGQLQTLASVPVIQQLSSKNETKIAALEKINDQVNPPALRAELLAELASLKTFVTEIRSERDTIKGGFAVANKGMTIFWTLCGSAITGAIAWVMARGHE